MGGPVYSAGQSATSIASWVIAEALGTFFLYLGIFGIRRNLPPAPRLLNIFLFSCVGLVLVFGSLTNLQEIKAGSVIGAVTFVVVSLLLSGFTLFNRSRNRLAHSWPKVQATIEESEVREVRTRSTHYFAAQFAYSYEMNGEYYSGRFERTFESEADAADYEQALKGKSIFVNANPQRPEDSQVLDPPALS